MKTTEPAPRSVEFKKPVSDPWLKRFLGSVSVALGSDVTVHSGDRTFVPKGGSKTSQHLDGRAADIKAKGLTPEQIFAKLRAAAASLPCPMAGRYQILYHGNHTATEASHVHIGRYHFLDKKNVRCGYDFWVEGDSKETRGKYRKVDSVDLGDGWA